MNHTASLRRLRTDLLADTASMTRAQQSFVDACVLTHKSTKLMPDAALAIATDAGFPVNLKPAPPGLATALVRHLKG